MSNMLTPKERHVMEHATAWKRGRYRNYFHTSHGTDDYPICAELERRGLMRSRVYELDETSIRGTSLVFYVTQHGFAALESDPRDARIAELTAHLIDAADTLEAIYVNQRDHGHVDETWFEGAEETAKAIRKALLAKPGAG